METFSEPREFVEHSEYIRDRERVMSALTLESIDAPILDIVMGFGKFPHCFTLQSCYGHFLWSREQNEENVDLLPIYSTGLVTYRIAYVALCIQNGDAGAKLRDGLASICEVDTEYVQFGSPDWFWDQYPNSYAVQVEPGRAATRDEVKIEHVEALHLQRVRDEFFQRLRKLISVVNGNSMAV